MTQQLIHTDTMQTRQLAVIELLCKGLSHEAIATELGISRSTVERELHSWYNSEAFNTWLKTEWHRLYGVVLDKSPKTAFKALTQLIKRGGVDININATLQETKEIRYIIDMSKAVPKSAEEKSTPAQE